MGASTPLRSPFASCSRVVFRGLCSFMWRGCLDRALPPGTYGATFGRLFVPILSHSSNLPPQQVQDADSDDQQQQITSTSLRSSVSSATSTTNGRSQSLVQRHQAHNFAGLSPFFNLSANSTTTTTPPSRTSSVSSPLGLRLSPLPSRSSASCTFHMERCIGTGGFGSVFEVVSLIDHQRYALKRIPMLHAPLSMLSASSVSDDDMHEAVLEAHCHATVSGHPNICTHHGSWIEPCNMSVAMTWETPPNEQPVDFMSQGTIDSQASAESSNLPNLVLLIVMDRCEGATLKEWMGSVACGNNRLLGCVSILYQLLSAAAHVHSLGWVHGDISPPNIFISPTASMLFPRVRLGDFGLSRKQALPSEPLSLANLAKVGTWLYASPELRAADACGIELGATSSCDIFSIGVVLFEMLSGPFATTMERIVFLEKAQLGMESIDQPPTTTTAQVLVVGGRGEDVISEEWAAKALPELWSLAKQMTNPCPSMRPTCNGILGSPLFAPWRNTY
eukprot:c6208_g1_i1.p1 GENE.c6208_g1_i1~~c6208_g1_i1.p1  ORF type:complete len:505 (+),score=99.31 c6208_g1_i1:1-1515(+)